MQTTAIAAAGPDQVRALAAAGNEPAWLAEWRLNAWDSYAAAEMPDRVLHLWRYSEPEKFLPDRVEVVMPGTSPRSTERFAGLEQEPAGWLLVEDGSVRKTHLEERWRDAGVVITDMSSALSSHEEVIREHLGSAVGLDAGKFEALNAALFAGGVFVYVPRNVHVEQPLHLIQRGTLDRSGLFTRLLLVMEEGAQATVIDEYANGGDPRVLANSVVEGVVSPNATLAYFNIQRWGNRTRSHARQRFLVQRDGAVTTVNIGLGGHYNKADLANVQRGKGAQSEMIGVMFGSGRQHFDNHTEHVHEASNSSSDMDFKVVLEDEAHSVYTGLIRIDLQAENCEAYQENRNLMLDPTCRAESIPELEILNENVSCTHGATVGPIDQEQVYYLKTRGLPEREAERLIVEGFFGPALDRIDDDDLRDRLWGYIAAKLEGRSA